MFQLSGFYYNPKPVLSFRMSQGQGLGLEASGIAGLRRLGSEYLKLDASCAALWGFEVSRFRV